MEPKIYIDICFSPVTMGDGCLSALDGRADSGPAKEAVAICIRRPFCGGV